MAQNTDDHATAAFNKESGDSVKQQLAEENRKVLKWMGRYRKLSYVVAGFSVLSIILLVLLQGLVSPLNPISEFLPLLLVLTIIQTVLFALVGRYAHESSVAWGTGMVLYVLLFVSGLVSSPRLTLIFGVLGIYWGWRGRSAIRIKQRELDPSSPKYTHNPE